MDTNHQILSDLKNYLLLHLGEEIKDVILFGSRITTDYTVDSDYDVLIIVNRSYDNKYEETVYNLCYDLDLKYDILIDPHILSTSELKTLRGKQPIFINAINKGLHA